jgi:hypothetical protein
MLFCLMTNSEYYMEILQTDMKLFIKKYKDYPIFVLFLENIFLRIKCYFVEK